MTNKRIEKHLAKLWRQGKINSYKKEPVTISMWTVWSLWDEAADFLSNEFKTCKELDDFLKKHQII